MDEAAPVEARALRGDDVLADPLVRELLALRLVGVLGTIARDGTPHLTPLWFADAGGAIVMATGASSQKVAHLEHDPRATLVVHDSRAGLDVRGASVSGAVEVVRGDEAGPLVGLVHRRYVDARAERLPAVAAFLGSDDVALRLVPVRGWTWDQRGTPAARDVAASGWALPLEPTS